MADKWTVEITDDGRLLELRRDGWYYTTFESCHHTVKTIQRIAAILNGEPKEAPAKVGRPWRVTERVTKDPAAHHWSLCYKDTPIGPHFFTKDGWTQDDAELLASRRNAREAQAKPRYEAKPWGEGLNHWYVKDHKDGRIYTFPPDYPGGPEPAARNEAARLNAAEGVHGK